MTTALHFNSQAQQSAAECSELRELRAALEGQFADIVVWAQAASGREFLAREISSGLPRRISVLTGETRTDHCQMDALWLRARTASGLHHPNILRRGEIRQAGKLNCRLSEYVASAETLRARLRRHGWLKVDQAVRIAGQIAEALTYAHAQGVVHLQLQPERILLCEQERVLVTGFGWPATFLNEDAAGIFARPQCEQIAYCSPELFSKQQTDYRSDWYALGAMLYEMLTDRIPFDSADPQEILRKRLWKAPLAPHLINEGISEEISALVLHLLERNPQQRLTSLRAFQEALEAQPWINQQGDEQTGSDDDCASQIAHYETTRLNARITAPLTDSSTTSHTTLHTLCMDDADNASHDWGKGMVSVGRISQSVAAHDFRPERNKFAGMAEPSSALWQLEIVAETESAPSGEDASEKVLATSITTIPADRSWPLRLFITGAGLLLTVSLGFVALHQRPRTFSENSEKMNLSSEVLPVAAVTPEPLPTASVSREPSAQVRGFFSEAIRENKIANRDADKSLTDRLSVETAEKTSVRAKNHSEKPGESDAAPAEMSAPGISLPPVALPPTSRMSLRYVAPVTTPSLNLVSGFSTADEATGELPPPVSFVPLHKRERAGPEAVDSGAPLLVSRGALQGQVIHRRLPVYPASARNAGITGSVVVEIRISRKGKVTDARAVSGHAALRYEAEQAARQWKFSPTIINGVPMVVAGTITFNFIAEK